ncbi:hypothetical protein AVDCRST_MAG94-7140 [uncultured Leptolyngbya sp.]|uniref:Uncharacterized protein n=1 Tax=uncultured Leptolyngbya sp. TaxID=332963 RepID=A0A6J4PST2_9CYAN|nr:hypothetical protein AVDCRST_MAG94-7140 [uncultured Leptolyngbya sp.]
MSARFQDLYYALADSRKLGGFYPSHDPLLWVAQEPLPLLQQITAG